MSECVHEKYRVQISGPEFSVTYESGTDEFFDYDRVYFAARALCGAFQMAAQHLECPTLVLAEVVSRYMRGAKPSPLEEKRPFEQAFADAAESLIRPGGYADEHARRPAKEKAQP